MFARLTDRFDPFAADPAETPPSQPIRFIRHHMRPLRLVIVLSLAVTLTSAGLEVWLIFYTGQLVDMLAATRPTRLWAEHGTELAGVTVLVLIARPLLWIGREGLNDIAFRPNAVAGIRWRSHRHLLRQSVGWFHTGLSGRVASRVSEIGTSAAGAAYTVLHTLSFVGAYILGSFWLLTSVDVRLGIPLATWVLLYLGLMIYVVPRFRDASQRYEESQSELYGRLVDSYANIDIIKMFPGTESENADRRVFARTRSTVLKVQRFEVTINGGMMALGTVLMVGLVGYSILLWQSGDAPLGLVAASVALSFRVSGLAEWLLDAVTSLFGHLGATRNALETVGQPVDIPDSPAAGELAVPSGAIRFRQVSHHYGRARGGLNDLSLTIPAGQKVGLVGRSGAGKSTLINLLLRFYEAESGRIEIDGQDIRGVTQESLRRHIAVVGQNAALLHRSVRENLSPVMRDAAEIDAAVRAAAADTFIPGLVDRHGRRGLDAHTGERGVQLSGGQRQRITLARAILKDAPILILDEATSALDSESEAVIQSALSQVMADKTVIAIAHRLSTIADLDRIIVLDDGRVVEDGRHAELLAAGGVYATLWAHQSSGFLGT